MKARKARNTPKKMRARKPRKKLKAHAKQGHVRHVNI